MFNWLAPALPGAQCLDLFAGTGALGFEAVSRGASSAVLVESNPPVSAALARIRERLDAAGSVRVVEDDVLRWLERGPATRFDVVFIDPPSRLNLHARALAALAEGGWLCPGARVYLEFAGLREESPIPDGWAVGKRGKAGDVRYYLASRHPDGLSPGNFTNFLLRTPIPSL